MELRLAQIKALQDHSNAPTDSAAHDQGVNPAASLRSEAL